MMISKNLIVVGLVVLAPLTVSGQTLRSITIRVELDGKPVLTSITGDNGTPPPEVVWRYLKTYPFIPVRAANIKADPDNPLRLTLKGKITVDVPYGGKAEVGELKLQRKTEKEGWRIDESDVEKMAISIGLPPPPAEPAPPPPGNPISEMKPGASPPPTPPKSDAPIFGGSIWVWLLGGLVVLVLIAAIYRAMPREHRFDQR